TEKRNWQTPRKTWLNGPTGHDRPSDGPPPVALMIVRRFESCWSNLHGQMAGCQRYLLAAVKGVNEKVFNFATVKNGRPPPGAAIAGVGGEQGRRVGQQGRRF